MQWSKVRNEVRSFPLFRGSFPTSATFERLNASVRGRMKSSASVELGFCKARFSWNAQISHQLPISKKRDLVVEYKQEHHQGKEGDEQEEDMDESWPVNEDIEDIDERWRVNAADYFKEPRIQNVVAEDGTIIDWEGESDRGLIQEISSVEWERTAFHHSPLIVLLFERYSRANTNWKALKELENAIKVYRKYKKLPPRTVKVDARLEIDLISALKAKDIPQLLFIKDGKLLYRETEIRTADELVKMIAHFYYNAKRPPFLKEEFF